MYFILSLFTGYIGLSDLFLISVILVFLAICINLKYLGAVTFLAVFTSLVMFSLAVQNILHFDRQIFLMTYLSLEMNIFRHLALRHIGVLSLISLVESSLFIILATKLLRYQKQKSTYSLRRVKKIQK